MNMNDLPKMPFDQRVKTAVAELIRDAARSDRSIARISGIDAQSVGRRRAKLEQDGIIQHYASLRDSSGALQPGSGHKRKAEYVDGRVPFARRVAEVQRLANTGMSLDQLAERFDVHPDTVRELVRTHQITIPANSVTFRSKRLDPVRLVTETVHSMAALANGVERIRSDTSDIFRLPPEEISYLYDEAVAALPNLTWLVKRLKWLKHMTGDTGDKV